VSAVPPKPQYLRVRNWEKFQHYKDRRPVWIKYHVELLDDYELTNLDYVTQLLYDRLLLLAARTDNNIPNDPSYIGRIVSIAPKYVSAGLEKLLIAGFIVVAERKRAASKSIARRSAAAIPETETDREKRKRDKDPVDLPRMNLTPVLKAPVEPHTLGAGRDAAFALLLTRVVGQDQATPKVLWGFCKKLPADRIEGVAELFAGRCVNPGVAVNALKDAVRGYELEVSA
jgi:hypothetical protein